MKPTIKTAVRAIAARCDGAIAQDGQGFNSSDTSFGRFIATATDEHWTTEVLLDAYYMLRTYRDQLELLDIDYDELEPPQVARDGREAGEDAGAGRAYVSQVYGQRRAAKEKQKRHHAKYFIETIAGDCFRINFPYLPKIISKIKTIEGRRYDARSRSWSVPYAAWNALLPIIEEFDFGLEDDVRVIGERAAKRAMLEAVNPAAIETPPQITWEEGAFMCRFPYNPKAISAIKGLPRNARRWSPEEKIWVVLPVAAAKFAKIVDAFGFTVDKEAAGHLAEFALNQAEAQIASRQVDAELDIAGLGMTLRPYQRAGVAYASKNNRTFIADEMGLGKTGQAIVAAYHTEKFPVVVVCPASIKIQWTREIAKWLPEATTHIITGQSTYELPEAEFYIINYEILSHWIGELTNNIYHTVIFDESHFIKNPEAQRTQAAFKLIEPLADDDNTYLLTGTPIENRPIEYASQLNIIGMLDLFGGYQKFRSAYCWNNDTRSYDGARDLDNLNDILRANCFIRRLKADVLDELPEKQRAYLHLEPEPTALRKYKQAESNLTDWLRDRAKTMAEEEGIDFTAALAHVTKAATSEAEALVKITALRQLSAMTKIKASVEWIRSQAEPVVVFAHHREVVEQVAEAFNAPKIYGGMTATAKQAALDSFINGDVDIIVCSIDAAGVGIDGLQRASNVLFIEQAWTPSKLAQAEDRLHRIGQRNSVMAWYAKIDVAIDKHMFDMLKAKRAVVDAATEGTPLTEETSGMLAILSGFAEVQVGCSLPH